MSTMAMSTAGAGVVSDGCSEVLVLAGPTACGKTALAVEMAERIGGEIISADSCAVYRGMDIGSAKPSAVLRGRVRHHLLDVRGPDAPYSAGAFCADAVRIAGEIAGRGRVPLVAGGAMMWLRCLRDGLAERPRSAAVREELKRELKARGVRALHRELAERDAAGARRIHPHDRARIVRALEVARLTPGGMTGGAGGFKKDDGAGGGSAGLPMKAILLIPKDRAVLRERIRVRLDEMFAAGFVAETRRLMTEWDLGAESAALRAVGYRQVCAFLRGETATEAECRRLAWHATCQLAKRQLTWLRQWPGATALDPFAAGAREEALRIAEDFAGEWRGV